MPDQGEEFQFETHTHHSAARAHPAVIRISVAAHPPSHAAFLWLAGKACGWQPERETEAVEEDGVRETPHERERGRGGGLSM